MRRRLLTGVSAQRDGDASKQDVRSPRPVAVDSQIADPGVESDPLRTGMVYFYFCSLRKQKDGVLEDSPALHDPIHDPFRPHLRGLLFRPEPGPQEWRIDPGLAPGRREPRVLPADR